MNLSRVFDGVREVCERNILSIKAVPHKYGSTLRQGETTFKNKLTKVGLNSTARLYIATA